MNTDYNPNNDASHQREKLLRRAEDQLAGLEALAKASPHELNAVYLFAGLPDDMQLNLLDILQKIVPVSPDKLPPRLEP